MAERIMPTVSELTKTIKETARFIGRALTLRAFLPEQTLASHGDHLPSSVDEMLLQEPTPRTVYTYPPTLERTEIYQQGFNQVVDYTQL